MSDPENFVARWSRRKRETAERQTQADPAQATPAAAAEPGPEAVPPTAGGPPEPGFDPATLPAIDSITAASDIRAFLQAGVPAELTRAALRRVWTTDPAIRDFIGLAENQWDFTDPTAMPGFGPLEATDDVRQLVAQAMGKLGELPEPPDEDPAASPVPEGSQATNSAPALSSTRTSSQVSGMSEGNENPAAGGAIEGQDQGMSAAVPRDAARDDENGTARSRRPHGRALPQ